MVSEKASFMTDPAMAPEAPNVVEAVRFLRRFADLMSNGQNAAYLLNAAVMLESLAARIAASTGEEQLWRYKCETLTEDNDRLEDECEGLKNDIEGHLDLSRTLLGERDALAKTLEAREAELGELKQALKAEREQLAANSQSHERALAELRSGFDTERDGFNGERESFKSTIAGRDEELGRLREAHAGEREQLTQKLDAREAELAEVRLAFDRERDELRARLASREQQLVALRGEAERDSEWLKSRIAALEAKRVELRSALDRLGNPQVPPAGPDDGAARAASSEAGMRAPNPGTDPAGQEGHALVPVATLRHARAQFEYLARESIRRGDVATQVMCELGAYTLELALREDGLAEDSPPAGKLALSILAPDQAASVVSDTA